MNLKQIKPADEEGQHVQLVRGKKYLCGGVTSGDHPISWDVLRWTGSEFESAIADEPYTIPDDERELLLEIGIVLELPDTLIEAQRS